MKSIRHKKALVTGAASGIGRSIALALAGEGADVYLLDVDEIGLATVVAAARALGVNAIGAKCDLSQPAEISRVLAEMLREWPQIDILVNNAGVAYYGPTHSMTAAQWDWLMNINLLAPIQITRTLLPILREQPDAHILNVCSISGLVAGGRFAAYHTSKFGLIGFTEALRAEYGRRGLGVSALCPGPVLTNLYKSCASTKNEKTVPEPPRWLCCSVDAVSRAAIRSIRRNKRLTLVGPLAHLLAWSKWLAPWFLDFLNHFSRKRRKSVAAPVRRAA
ncbi:MAG: SDR family oxidoreductase [Planctomycetes bacterium]|nr:SDR family oxidoreductase [Planctomycetota bacterium]